MRRSFQLMNEGEVGNHNAKRLGLVYPAENLPAHSLQLVGNIVCQREYEGSVDALKRNIQPRAVIERHKCACAALVLKFMMMCSARAFFRRILSTANSWLKWLLVNLESTVSRS